MDVLIQWLDKHDRKPFPGMMSEKASVIVSSFTFFNELSSSLLDVDLVTSIFMNELVQHDLYADAVQFLAHGLEKQKAILWAYHCLRKPDVTHSKLELIKLWIQEPTEEIRLQCAEHSNDFKDPLTWLGLAVFWSGDNISMQKDVIIEPVSTLSAHGVATALILSAVRCDPENIIKTYLLYIEQGIISALNDNLSISDKMINE